MARNQGDFTVVVKRSRRTLETGTPRWMTTVAPTTETSDTRTPRGWAETASGTGAATPLRVAAVDEREGGVSEARRAAEKLFAPRRPVEPLVLPMVADVATATEGATSEPGFEAPASEAIADPSFKDISPAATEAKAVEPIVQEVPYAAVTAPTAPSIVRREPRRFERQVFPPGQRWLQGLPESCWPEAVRRAARRNRRRALRAAAKGDDPVQ